MTPPNRQRVGNAQYTADALRRKLQGTVVVQVVVMPDVSVDRARVVKSLDAIYGLDGQARLAAMLSTFEPNSGTLNGTPVPVVVDLVMTFRIH